MQKYAKFITAGLAFVGVILSSGLLDGATQAWVSTVVAGIGAALVYLLPNGGFVPEAEVAAKRDAKTGRFVSATAHAGAANGAAVAVVPDEGPHGDIKPKPVEDSN